jgi:hypothetical protein
MAFFAPCTSPWLPPPDFVYLLRLLWRLWSAKFNATSKNLILFQNNWRHEIVCFISKSNWVALLFYYATADVELHCYWLCCSAEWIIGDDKLQHAAKSFLFDCKLDHNCKRASFEWLAVCYTCCWIWRLCYSTLQCRPGQKSFAIVNCIDHCAANNLPWLSVHLRIVALVIGALGQIGCGYGWVTSSVTFLCSSKSKCLFPKCAKLI